MLELKGIKKVYETGGQKVEALRGVDIEFRKCEFVSILGQSGCGKTTLLNIIGGLDKYTSGDLIIRGRSTKKYSDREWDAYRNHSVGFVFQSYNLIPHQTVLANVELALTLSGVKRKERRKRAEEALARVGLGDQMLKKPNQLSGGQMQRVAIARAIVNDPEILLADEPTGALDSGTSVQVMEILKEIASDRLVIMVTHNPELAQRYSTRIVTLKDGHVTGDSDPYKSSDEKSDYSLKKNRSMSFFTALGLSVNNLLTKKGRTIMTCFAGSIGIIGIALILSVSNGVNRFIDKVQEDTLSKYPLTVDREQVDMSAMLELMSGGRKDGADLSNRDPDKVYSNDIMYRMVSSMTSVTTEKNNLTDFRKFIQGSDRFRSHTSAIRYKYDVPMNFYVKNSDGGIRIAETETVLYDMYRAMGVSVGEGSASDAMVSSYSSYMKVWEELLAGEDGELINPMLKNQYDVVYGSWPQNSHEAVLVLNERNELSDLVLYALGLKSSSELADAIKGKNTGSADAAVYTYEELCGMTFRLILAADKWQKQGDGSYTDISKTDAGLSYLFDDDMKYTEIRICGIIKPNENALFSMISGSVAYTSALTDEVMKRTADSDIVKAQLADPKTDVISGLAFRSSASDPDTAGKIAAVKEYFASLDTHGKAEIYTKIMSVPSEDYIAGAVSEYMKTQTRETITETLVAAYAEKTGSTDLDTVRAYFDRMSDDELNAMFSEQVAAVISEQYAAGIKQQLSAMSEEQLAALLGSAQFTDKQYESFWSLFLPAQTSDSTYEDNLKKLGYADPETPSGIVIYAPTFEDKNSISDLIEEYNSGVSEENEIKVTDYVRLLMSSVSTVINAVSYVLIAFVGISLVVSSIMIGVITNISVLERTKEIGVLRAVGASKADVARVFNAETFIIGLLAGLFGIGITLVLILPINLILHHFTGIAYLNAILPPAGGAVLVLLSMLLTVTAGLIPARSASKKDPVVSLRSE